MRVRDDEDYPPQVGAEPQEQPLVGTAASDSLPVLFERDGPMLYQLGLRICGSAQEAQDLVQETFLTAYRKWHQFRGESSARTWLYTIASRICRRSKRLRSGEPHRMASLDELLPGAAEPVPEVSWSEHDPFETTVRHETVERVGNAIAELPLEFRMPLVLKEIAGLSIEEVATVLDLLPATVKTRVQSHRLPLRRVLDAALPAREDPRVGSRQICVDLVSAKQGALDRGVAHALPDDLICERCEAVFATLDLTSEACRRIGRGELPEELRREILAAFAAPSSGAASAGVRVAGDAR